MTDNQDKTQSNTQQNIATKIALLPYNFFKSSFAKDSSGIAKAIATGVGIIYLISPIDLIPDFIPLFGQLDDGAILISMLIALGSAYLETKESKIKEVDDYEI
jgi:uncharacterized membrane protein YkvA (DUF1232 family)